MAKALIIFYSQAGQTEKAVRRFSAGLGRHLDVETAAISTVEPFRFPWSMTRFFRVFPLCVKSVTPAIHSLQIDWNRYDLIVLAYPVWFLSPALPMQAFLKSPEALALQGRPVLALATCRNLWHSASDWVRQKLFSIGAKTLGQVTVCELSPVWASFVTTPRWMLTGRKDRFWFFPPAGIDDAVFAELEQKADRIGRFWASSGQVPRVELGSNLDRVSLRLMDRIGRNFFEIWATLILTVSRQEGLIQDFLLILFRVNLIILIICVAPVTKFFEILIRPWPTWSRQFLESTVDHT